MITIVSHPEIGSSQNRMELCQDVQNKLCVQLSRESPIQQLDLLLSSTSRGNFPLPSYLEREPSHGTALDASDASVGATAVSSLVNCALAVISLTSFHTVSTTVNALFVWRSN